jgi:hypothetical protein
MSIPLRNCATEHEHQAFSHSIDKTLRILRERYQVRSVEVAPVQSSPLRLQDDRGNVINVHLPTDNVIGLYTLLHGHWDISKARFVARGWSRI